MPDTGRSSPSPPASTVARRIVVFLGNKLVSCDAVLPVLMEVCRRTGAGPVRFISLDAASYDAIQANVVLRDGIAAIGTIELLGRRRKTAWTWLAHRLRVAGTLMGLVMQTVRGRLVVLHFKALNQWPMRALYRTNRSATILCEGTAAGYNAVEQRIAGLTPGRVAVNPRLAMGAVLYFHDDWAPLEFARRHGRPAARLPDPYRLTAWRSYVDAREAEDFKMAGLLAAGPVVVYLLAWFGELAFLEGATASRELFEETLAVLIEEGNGRPIVIKPHVISDMDVVSRAVDKLDPAERGRVTVTNLHPSVLAHRSALFIANYYSTAMLPATSLGVPTIEFSRYNAETLAITNGGSMRPDIVSHFINGDAGALRTLVQELVRKQTVLADPPPETLSDDALTLLARGGVAKLMDAA